MRIDQLIVLVFVISGIAWLLGEWRARLKAGLRGGLFVLSSRPIYYGAYSFLITALPAFLFLLVWQLFEPVLVKNLILAQMSESYAQLGDSRIDLLMDEIENIANGALSSAGKEEEIATAAAYFKSLLLKTSFFETGLLTAICLLGLCCALIRIDPDFQARNRVEKIILALLFICSCIAILTTIGIVLSVLFESLRFFQSVSILEFMFGTHWSPQIAIRPDQSGSSGGFGAVPLFTGTLLISAIALLIAVPSGLMIAMYLGEYAKSSTRTFVKPLIEMLAGIPTVVYGFIAALSVAPVIRSLGESLNMSVSSESALAAGLVMGVMIIPFVSSLSDDIMNAVPQSLRDGALALGATRSETIRQIVFPAALPGIMGAVLLAASRAIGETMIVVMAAGLAASLTANPLESVTTITVQIVSLLAGDQEFDSPRTLAAFALGLMLFVTTLMLNFYALHIVKKYSQKYA